MTDTLGLLRRAVLDTPADDLPRLVLADALDERDGPGDAERSEFIRVQVELAKPYDVHAHTYWLGQLDTPPDVSQRERLRRRERELFHVRCGRWFPVPDGYYLDWEIALPGESSSHPERPGYVVRRGFVSELRVPRLADLIGGERCEECDGHGDHPWADERTCTRCNGSGRTPDRLAAIFGQQPVTAVSVTAAEPLGFVPPGGSRNPPWRWLRDDGSGGRAMVPDEVFDRMRVAPGVDRESAHWGRFADSREAADKLLSDSIVSLARSRCGLRPLTPAEV